MAATHHRHGSRTLPRRPSAHADSTTPAGESEISGRLLPRSPTAFPFRVEGRLQRETIEACSEFKRLSACASAPRLHRGLPRRLQWAISRLNCSSGYRANRQFPGRDFHPLAFETQEVSPYSETQLTSNLLPCRTPWLLFWRLLFWLKDTGSCSGPALRRWITATQALFDSLTDRPRARFASRRLV